MKGQRGAIRNLQQEAWTGEVWSWQAFKKERTLKSTGYSQSKQPRTTNEREWFLNTLMLQGYDVPFKYKRKKKYRDLKGASVNLTYYPDSELIAGMEFELMKVVRIRVS